VTEGRPAFNCKSVNLLCACKRNQCCDAGGLDTRQRPHVGNQVFLKFRAGCSWRRARLREGSSL
jgi:hypothetical protein